MDLDHRIDPNLTREQAIEKLREVYAQLDEAVEVLCEARERAHRLEKEIRQRDEELEPDVSWLVDEK